MNLILFKTRCGFLVFNFQIYFLQRYCTMVASLLSGNLLENVSEVVGNPLANLLQGVRGYWQPSRSSKFV
jgi:hypothetical protein